MSTYRCGCCREHHDEPSARRVLSVPDVYFEVCQPCWDSLVSPHPVPIPAARLIIEGNENTA